MAVRMPTDTTLYDLRNKQDMLEPLPAGNWALNEEPLLDGDRIWLRVGSQVYDCEIVHDGYEWYARDVMGSGEYALLEGRLAWRRSAPR